MLDLIPLANLPAALLSAQPGAIVRVALANGTVATILLSALSSSAEPPAKSDPWAEYHPAIGELRASGLSVQAAAIRLVDEGRVPLRNTLPSSRANALAKSYRAAHMKLKASAFDFQPVYSTPAENSAILLSETERPQMQNNYDKALGADKLTIIRRRAPQRFLLDLDAEGLSDATRDDILNPLFWRDVTHSLIQGDVVFVSSSSFNGEIIIGPESDGGFHVAVLAEHAPARQSEAA